MPDARAVYSLVGQGLGAGFVAVCVGSPVDVVKSRVMGDKQGQYKGMADCIVKTYSKEARPAR